MNKAPKSDCRGFTLFEVLVSLLILGGSLAGITGGFFAAEQLDRQARFEERAAFFAEREIELLKTDLVGGRRSPAKGAADGRFRLPGGWKSRILWEARQDEDSVRVIARVRKGDESFVLDSFLFLPPGEAARR